MLSTRRCARVFLHHAVEGAGLDEVVVLGVAHRRVRARSAATRRSRRRSGSPVCAGPSKLLGS